MNINQKIIEELEGLAGQKFTLGNFLGSIRQEGNLSQVEFANALGVSKQFICDLEHHRRSLSLKMAETFALKLGYSAKQFVRLCLQDMIQKQGLHYLVELEEVA